MYLDFNCTHLIYPLKWFSLQSSFLLFSNSIKLYYSWNGKKKGSEKNYGTRHPWNLNFHRNTNFSMDITQFEKFCVFSALTGASVCQQHACASQPHLSFHRKTSCHKVHETQEHPMELGPLLWESVSLQDPQRHPRHRAFYKRVF